MATKGNTGFGKLLYAIVLTDQACDFGPIGVDNQKVHGIGYDGIAALVSHYPQVSAIKVLRKNLAPYHRVIREAAARFTAIPARFGQIARDDGEVQLALRRSHGSVYRELQRLDGKLEMGVSVWWNADDPLAQWLEADAELRARRDRLRSGAGGVGRMEQIEFGRFFLDRMAHAREAICGRVLAALPSSCEVKVGESNDDRTIASLAVLLERDRRDELEEAVDALGESMGDVYGITLDGPWPPFSFVDRLELRL